MGCTMLYNHHHYLVLEHSYHLKWKLSTYGLEGSLWAPVNPSFFTTAPDLVCEGVQFIL